MSSLSSAQGASPFFFLPWILLSSVLAGFLHVEAKGTPPPPPLYIYVAPTASLLRRIVYVDNFSISPGLTCESQWPYVASSSLNPSLFAGEQYSGQTWVRSSPPGLHGDHVLRIGHGSSPERCLQVITTPRKIVTNKEW